MSDLALRCKDVAKEGLWILYREFLGEIRDDNKSKLEFFEQYLKEKQRAFGDFNREGDYYSSQTPGICGEE